MHKNNKVLNIQVSLALCELTEVGHGVTTHENEVKVTARRTAVRKVVCGAMHICITNFDRFFAHQRRVSSCMRLFMA